MTGEGGGVGGGEGTGSGEGAEGAGAEGAAAACSGAFSRSEREMSQPVAARKTTARAAPKARAGEGLNRE